MANTVSTVGDKQHDTKTAIDYVGGEIMIRTIDTYILVLLFYPKLIKNA